MSIKTEFPEVWKQYVKDGNEHARMIESDPYYAHCYGGGVVPEPCCRYCTNYDGDRCMKDWNNAEEDYYIPDRDDKEPFELCECYQWNDEWEDD